MIFLLITFFTIASTNSLYAGRFSFLYIISIPRSRLHEGHFKNLFVGFISIMRSMYKRLSGPGPSF